MSRLRLALVLVLAAIGLAAPAGAPARAQIAPTTSTTEPEPTTTEPGGPGPGPTTTTSTTSTTSATTTTTRATSTTSVPTTTTRPTTTTATAATSTTTSARSSTTTGLPIAETTTTTARELSGGDDSPDPTAPEPTFPLGDNPTTTTGLGIKADQPTRELAVVYMEITQGIQNLKNDMPLVAERVTMVRLHVKTASGAALGVRGVLSASRNGKALGQVAASNQPIVAKTKIDRLDTDGSLWFVLPAAWITAGEVALTGFVYDGTVQATLDNEQDLADNYMTTLVAFNQGSPLRITTVPLHLHAVAHSSQPDRTYYPYTPANAPTTASMLLAARRFFPVPAVEDVSSFYLLSPSNHAKGEEWDLFEDTKAEQGLALKPLAALAKARTSSDALNDRYWYGTIDPSVLTALYSFTSDEYVTFGGVSAYGAAMGKFSDSHSGGSPWSQWGGSIIGHELLHAHGFAHVNCNGTEEKGGAIDPNYPRPAPNCSLAGVALNGYFGFDTSFQGFDYLSAPEVISNDPTATAPHFAGPIMGYVGPGWIDPYTYCKTLPAYGIPCDVKGALEGLALPTEPSRSVDVAGARLAGTSRSLTSAGDALVVRVSGVVSRRDDTSTLIDVEVRDDIPASAVDELAAMNARFPDSPWSVVALAADGRELARQRVYSEEQGSHVELDAMLVLALLPVDEAPVRVVLRRDDRDVADRVASPSAPSVLIRDLADGETLDAVTTLRWEATDGDNDDLSFDILYSADGGSTWRMIASGVEGTSFEIDARKVLPASEDGRLRVVAVDGFSSGSAMSGRLIVGDAGPPNAIILSPSDGRTVRLHEAVVFEGMATDLEEGNVTDLRWRSDRDGELGSGALLVTRDLTPGAHVVTLVASDSQGGTAESTVRVLVDGENPADLPSTNESDEVARLIAAHLDDDRGDRGAPLGGILGIALVAALLGVAMIMRRRRRKRIV